MEPQLLIEGRQRDVGGFFVRRVLPSAQKQLVGPFIFYDHLCRVDFAAGHGLDVRPHPHIGLATVTYLFEGAFLHRDTLGYTQLIRPGDVNWMISGRGIAHSERTPPDLRQSGGPLHGIQCWVALPLEHEEVEPSFMHHPGSTIPKLTRPGARLAIIAGTAYGVQSPVTVLSPTLYVHAQLAAGARLEVDDQHAERAVYVVEGAVSLGQGGQEHGEGTLLVLSEGEPVQVTTSAGASIMLLGGAPLPGARHIYWNFVSSSLGRIEQAKADWQAGRFGTIAGDEREFIPLPEV
jgi:redox-sensitive bicupin YhaK (pirin superfamily)